MVFSRKLDVPLFSAWRCLAKPDTAKKRCELSARGAQQQTAEDGGRGKTRKKAPAAHESTIAGI